ncbi:hypothetical protein HPB50_020227 [Hyalomma asiaticum]|uniref:Uncharacterized protein n=1 Tax=Hyalomma asiaticum TaxID=266040 RepID=A0ACB7SPQ5_HYAAI|nr:hypothetical protein HPB50_020227 [Hyalomma asiaticum]
MAEQGPVESERASPAPGDSPRSGGSVFSADGDSMLVGIPPINLGVQMQTAYVAAPSGVPAPPPAALPSGSLFPNNEPGEEVTQAAFHRAISYQKDITDLLFDPACKVNNTQRSKIIALLRSILQECADIRAVAARQAGRVDELRYQLARPSTVSTGVPGVINPAHPVPGPSYASVLAGKHNSEQVASRMTAPSTLPPHTVQVLGTSTDRCNDYTANKLRTSAHIITGRLQALVYRRGDVSSEIPMGSSDPTMLWHVLLLDQGRAYEISRHLQVRCTEK